MASNERTKGAMVHLEMVMCRADNLAQSLSEAVAEGDRQPHWVWLFQTTVWELRDAGNALVEAINADPQ